MTSRSRWVAVVVGVAAIGGGLFLFLRDDGDRRAVRRGVDPREAPPPVRRLRGQDAGAAAGEGARPEEPPEPADASTDFTVPPETAALVDDAHEHLQDAARPCPSRVRTKLTRKGLFLQFQYTLTIEGGQARPAGLAVQNTDMTDPALVACMVEEMKQARWVAGAAGSNTTATVTVDDTITLGELR